MHVHIPYLCSAPAFGSRCLYLDKKLRTIEMVWSGFGSALIRDYVHCWTLDVSKTLVMFDTSLFHFIAYFKKSAGKEGRKEGLILTKIVSNLDSKIYEYSYKCFYLKVWIDLILLSSRLPEG